MRYRIEVAEPTVMGPDGYVIPQEQIAVYEDCGWEYVTSRGRFHYFRAPEGSEAPEFYEDPRQQAETLKGLRKRLFIGMGVLVLVLALMILPFSVVGRSITSPFMLLLTIPGIAVFWFFFLLRAFVSSAVNLVLISRTYRRLKNGIPLDHSPKSKGMLYVFLDRLIWAVGLLCLVLTLVQLTNMQRTALPAESDGPYIVLSDIGIEGERGESFGRSSRLESTSSVLSECWHTSEYAETNTGGTTVSLYQTVYRLNSFMSSKFWIRRLTKHQAFVKDLDEYTPVQIDGLDAAWISENGIEAAAVKGQMIAIIEFLDGKYSTQRLTDILNALAVRWKEY